MRRRRESWNAVGHSSGSIIFAQTKQLPSMAAQFSVRITGKVQGVFFRQSAREQARRLGLTGFVRNDPDGSVYAEIAGAPEATQAFIAWCHKGPAHARVDAVHVQPSDPKISFDGFEIRH
jgi:acylphosphatase